ncbi:threonine/serine ThrE exporter family protein [Tomitella fengzijianii]|uniref:Threonine/serine exporter family protein n=1 Tax=Tomitella fengzijianii TaxID=2597660 RepID=A0A516WZX0_9ACTN|nr:threonine/serine exporter family protein [Tomitella fengzijianii]QDQ96287.1 threonine/serine exporter family protein [Tomitella fengzijianii]
MPEPSRPNGTHDRDYVHRVLDAALRIGSLLLSSNSGTADVAATMSAITGTYGLQNTQLDVTATTIILSVPRGVEGAPLTVMWHVKGRSLDYTRLHTVLDFAQQVADERPDLDWVHRRIDELDAAPPPYNSWVSTVAFGAMAASFSVLLGAGAVVVAIAAVTTSVIDRIGRILADRGLPILFRQAVAGLVATGVTLSLDAVGRLPEGANPSLVVAANIVALMSGMAIVSSVQDSITGYYLTSVGRIMEILLSMVGIFVGVGAALRIGDAFHVDASVSPESVAGWLSVPVMVAAGAVGAAAAAVSSYAPARAAGAAGAAGSLGALIYFGMMHLHAGNVASSFVAATAIGLAGAVVAHRFSVPPLVIVMSGIVPLVPGVTTYRGFVTLVEGHSAQGVGTLVVAAGTAVALAAGVVFGPLLAPVTRRQIRQMRTLGAELGPRFDSRWSRTPTLAGIDLRRRHFTHHHRRRPR